MTTRKCSHCSKVLSITEFGKDKHSHSNDGISYYCKKCMRVKATVYRKTGCFKIFRKNYVDSGRSREYSRLYRKTEKRQKQIKADIAKKVAFNRTPEGKRKTKEYDLRHRYGISLDRHYQLWVNQKGRCDLCGKPVNYEKVHTDHNHISNKLRGLTCHQCNCLLGFAFVDEFGVEILNKAIEYVKRHEQK